MSHSITTTASYVLSKYSRSYPPTSSQAGTSTQAPVESEWQHFTNPVMKIILEVKKSPSGQLVSMRLKILWGLRTESSDLHIDQWDVVFEDLELLSFSSLQETQTSVAKPDQSLPLKAVYRDAVVGIRYLHPRIVPPGSQSTYRRFQITFKDALDASQCIDIIKSVCPCKANPHPSHICRHPTMLSASSSLARAATAVPCPAPVRRARLTEHQSITSAPIDSNPVPSSALGHHRENRASSIAPAPMTTSLSSDDSAFVTCSETSHRMDTLMDHRKDGAPPHPNREPVQSSLPNSSQPSSSDQSINMPPPPVPQRAVHSADGVSQEPSRAVNTSDERSQLLASLSKHSSLYELPRADLEILVGQVIREEGFLKLLESLDTLWEVKGFLGR